MQLYCIVFNKGNTLCWLMKTPVLLLLLLHCSYGITVTPTSFAASLALTTVLQLYWSPTVQSIDTATSLMTSVDIVIPSVTFPIETSLIIFTDIITPSVVFPIDTVTQTVLLTTDIGTINMSITPALTSFTTSLTTLFTSSVSNSSVTLLTSGTITSNLQSPATTSTIITMITSVSESVAVIFTSTIPSPSPTVALPILVVMRFSTSTNVKRDASNYTDIESEIANAAGISADRINIVTVIIGVNEIVINAEILDLSSTEFIALNDLFINRNVSITYQGMVYFSSSIMRQLPECNEYIERNYFCDAVNVCPSNLICQPVSNNMSQFCVPCRCNLVSDNTTCNDNCISNVCVPLSSTTTATIPTNPTTSKPSSGGLSGRAVAGIVVGVIIPIVPICVIVVYCIHRRRIRKRGRFIPKQISMKKANTYDGIRKHPAPPQWDSTIYRNTNEMFTLSQQLAEQDNEDDDKVQEYSMHTDL